MRHAFLVRRRDCNFGNALSLTREVRRALEKGRVVGVRRIKYRHAWLISAACAGILRSLQRAKSRKKKINMQFQNLLLYTFHLRGKKGVKSKIRVHQWILGEKIVRFEASHLKSPKFPNLPLSRGKKGWNRKSVFTNEFWVKK